MTNSTYVPLQGALNLRDIGGYAADGGRIRRGVVFRSDHLSTLTEADLDTIDQLGIRSVFDFRGQHEIELQPSRLWPSVNNHVLVPITGDTVQEKTFVERVVARELTRVTDTEVGASYITMLEQRGYRFATVLESIAQTDQRPILFHCTAGKDRTGLAAALIHGLCGVSREDIVYDFELSNTYRLPSRISELRAQFEQLGIDIEPLVPAISAPPQAMHMALDHLDAKHGGVREYLTHSLGLNAHQVDAIRSALIE